MPRVTINVTDESQNRASSVTKSVHHYLLDKESNFFSGILNFCIVPVLTSFEGGGGKKRERNIFYLACVGKK